jgi:signal peptidase II
MSKDFKKMAVIYLAVIFFVALDRFLKVFAFASQTSEFNLLGEVLKFSYKANYYIAFSLPVYGVWLNIAVLLIILSLIIYLFKIWRAGERGLTVSLSVVILAASSNLYDRLKYGFVVDYFDLKYFTVFNLADVMIVLGIIMLLVLIYKKEAV